jgi:(p)ppGpp synthase/HD superfamily hydrolase
MTGLRTHEHNEGTTTVYATLETTGIEQLTRLLNKLEMVRGVTTASRLREGVYSDSRAAAG